MEVISLNVNQKRFGWKDWFIQETPINTEKLYIFYEKTFHFDIDPLFEIFEIEGILKNAEPVMLLNYMFTDERMIERIFCYSFKKPPGDYSYIKVTIKK
jgi:hypothetical protein